MSWKGLVAVLALGSQLVISLQTKYRTIPYFFRKALKMVKQALSHKGEITGSWVHMVPETFEKYDVAYEVYRGGLTTMLNDIQERFEFLVDAKTGTVLKVIAA